MAAGDCLICDKGYAAEVNYRLARNDPLNYIAEKIGTSAQNIINHRSRGHIPEWVEPLAEWNQKHKDARQIEVARKLEIEKAPTLTPADISARLLALERYAMRVLSSLEADADFRGSIQAVEALRRLTSDLATVNGAGKPAQDPSDYESVDTKQLREGIEEMFRKGHGSPDTVPWQPLR
jgi:hypothetical protein